MIRRGAFRESIGAPTDTIDSPVRVQVNLPKHQGLHQTKAVRICPEDNMKNSNHDTNGITSRLIRSFRSTRLIKATMIWICLSSALGLFKNSISFSIDGSVKRQLLSSQFVDSILFPAEGNADWKWSSERIQNDFSFRQPRVLHVDPQFYALQNAVNEVPRYEAANHEIQITKRARRAKKNLENSKQYRKWLRDPLREGDCEPMKPWQETSFPSCNKIHETDIQSQFEVLTNGGYNTVFTLTDTDGSTHIVKILKYTKDYTDRNLDRVRRDSLIMERATNSDYVVNTYSYCGFSQIIEYGRGGNLYSRIATEYDRLSQNQKLQIATQVSQALADVQNLEGNSISSMTHGDFASKQYILVDGRLKLSDFNRGRFLRWDTEKQEPCPYTIGKNDGKVGTNSRLIRFSKFM